MPATLAILESDGLNLRAEGVTLEGRKVCKHIGGSIEDAFAMGHEPGEHIKSLGGAKLLSA